MIGYNGTVNLRNDGIDPSTTKKDLNAAIGASITVRFAGVPIGQGVKADLFDIDDISIPNPVTSDNFGNYFFKIATGTYDIIFQEGTANEVIEPSQAIGQTAELINDLSQAYEFDTWQLMKGSVIPFPDGKKLITARHTVGFNVGSATYIKTSGASPDALGSPDLSGGGYAKIQHKDSIANAASYGCLPDSGATDSSAPFMAAVASKLSVFLPVEPTGQHYKIIGATLNDEQVFYSYGARIGSIGNNTSINHGEKSTIEGVNFIGGGRNGLDTLQRAVSIVSVYFTKTLHCGFDGLSGDAIYTEQVLRNHEGGLIDGNKIVNCNNGVTLSTRAEYFKIPNNTINLCNVGLNIFGGNNIANGTSVTDCTVAVYLRTDLNDAHGSLVGCSLNHNVHAVRTENIVSKSFTFVGCNLFATAIWLENCTGITFKSCEVSSCIITEENCRECYFIDATFVQAVTVIPNANGTESEVFYLDTNHLKALTPITPGGAGGFNGGYSKVSLDATQSGNPAGETDIQFDDIEFNSITNNVLYTVQTFYGDGTGTDPFIKGNTAVVRGGVMISITAQITVIAAGNISITSDKIQIKLVDSVGNTAGFFTAVTYISDPADFNRLRFVYNGQIRRNDYKLVLDNKTGVNVDILVDQPLTDIRSVMEVTDW